MAWWCIAIDIFFLFLKTAEPIQFTKSIQNIVVSEHQSATFECEVSFDDAVVTWYKGPTELRESPKYSFRSEGRCHYMTIHNVTAEDEGKNAWDICAEAILLSDCFGLFFKL